MADTGVHRIADRLTHVLENEAQVVAAWLFGSQAAGRAVGGSDVDIGILTSGTVDWEYLAGLRGRLEDALDGREADVVDVRAADPILAFEAVSGRVLLKRDLSGVAEAVSLIAREYESSIELIKLGMRYRAELAAE